MKKVLVTGGAGFVGRHIVKRSLENGDEVWCVDSLVPLTGGVSPDTGWPLFEPCDYSRFHFLHEDCRQFFRRGRDTDFDYVFHLAAIVGGRLMIEQNPLGVADDLSIDSEFWQWTAKVRPAKVVCFSSSAAYPIKYQRREDYRLLAEDMISFELELGQPDMSYGWAKLTHEYLAKLAFERHGIESVVYRPFSGYGEDQDETYPFPSICQRALVMKGADTLSVWGTGEQMRDFIHIDDCVDAVFATIDRIDNADALNLSTGVYTSFITLAEMAAEICGYHPRIVGMSDRPSGVFARAGDTAKQRSFGIVPKIPLEVGVRRCLDYFQAQAEAKR